MASLLLGTVLVGISIGVALAIAWALINAAYFALLYFTGEL